MPIYEYQCEKCGHVKEVMQKLSDNPLTECASCSGKMNKIISQSAFHLKGTGWYVTDYAGKTPEKKSDSAAEAKSGVNESKSNEKKAKAGDD